MSKLTGGFTLLELLLTVAIIAVLGVASTGFTARFYRQNDVVNTTERLVQSLRKAQSYSMAGKYNGTKNDWGVNYSANKITLFLSDATLADPYTSRSTAFDEIWNVSSSVSLSGLSQVSFSNATGLPSTTATITISAGSTSRTVTLNSQGVVSF